MSSQDAPDNVPVKAIEIHQQKSNFFRVVHADGAWCSVNAWQNIHMTFFSERYPIPSKVFFDLNDKGVVVGENVSKREIKKDWFREMEVDVVLSLDAARQVRETLDRFIKILEDVAKSASEG